MRDEVKVAVPKVWQRSDSGDITDETYAERLEKLGRLVVEMSETLGGARREEPAGAEA